MGGPQVGLFNPATHGGSLSWGKLTIKLGGLQQSVWALPQTYSCPIGPILSNPVFYHLIKTTQVLPSGPSAHLDITPVLYNLYFDYKITYGSISTIKLHNWQTKVFPSTACVKSSWQLSSSASFCSDLETSQRGLFCGQWIHMHPSTQVILSLRCDKRPSLQLFGGK